MAEQNAVENQIQLSIDPLVKVYYYFASIYEVDAISCKTNAVKLFFAVQKRRKKAETNSLTYDIIAHITSMLLAPCRDTKRHACECVCV